MSLDTDGLRLRDPGGDFNGWRCKPVSGITGRLEQIGDAVLVLAWPTAPGHGKAVAARLLYVPANWITGTEPSEDDWK